MMTRTRTKIATASQSSRVQHLLCWASIPIVLCAASLQDVAARNGVGHYSPLHVSEAATRPKGSVRSELIRQQAQTGLTFAWIHEGVKVVSFKERAVVPVQGFLDAFRPDAFSFQEYPQVMTIDMCWSHDQSKLAATMADNPPNASLEVLDLKSKLTSAIAPRVGQTFHVTSQCWSPDDKQLVFEIEGSVRVYDLESGKTSVLASGTGPRENLNPTWSPDGKQIAFLESGAYYSISPSGGDRKKLFTKKNACSGLSWSPDSRIVAYVEELGFLQGGALDAEVNRVRVRRLEDGSDDWIANGTDCILNYRWIVDQSFMSLRKSTP
jgi:WD40-like Beta Propeller Repeat